jgi:hypothetical protein
MYNQEELKEIISECNNLKDLQEIRNCANDRIDTIVEFRISLLTEKE